MLQLGYIQAMAHCSEPEHEVAHEAYKEAAKKLREATFDGFDYVEETYALLEVAHTYLAQTQHNWQLWQDANTILSIMAEHDTTLPIIKLSRHSRILADKEITQAKEGLAAAVKNNSVLCASRFMKRWQDADSRIKKANAMYRAYRCFAHIKREFNVTVHAAYGRIYKSAAEAQVDWDSNKDFRIVSIVGMGSYINKADAEKYAAGEHIMLRFNNDRDIAELTG